MVAQHFAVAEIPPCSWTPVCLTVTPLLSLPPIITNICTQLGQEYVVLSQPSAPQKSWKGTGVGRAGGLQKTEVGKEVLQR